MSHIRNTIFFLLGPREDLLAVTPISKSVPSRLTRNELRLGSERLTGVESAVVAATHEQAAFQLEFPPIDCTAHP